MNERNKHDEVFWNDLLEEIDLEVGDLAAAEARMSAAEEVELAPGQAEKMVRHATHGVPVLKLREPKANPFRRWLRAALILMGSSTTLTVGTVAAATTVVAVYLVWSVGRNSKDTMSYEQALELLARSDQPEAHRSSAMGKIHQRIAFGITTLRAIRDDTAAPTELVSGARSGLAWIEELLSVQPPPLRQTVREDLDRAAEEAVSATLTTTARLQGLGRVVEATSGDICALRSMPDLSPDLIEGRDRTIRFLQFELKR